MESRGLRIGLRAWTIAVLLFLYVPIALIILYAFNKARVEPSAPKPSTPGPGRPARRTADPPPATTSARP